MRHLIWGLCLISIATPGYAALFQQTKDKDKANTKAESPVKVTVQGANEELAKNLQAFLPTMRNLDCNTPSDRLQRFIDSSTPKLQEGAEAMGYYSARFSVTPVRQGDCLALTIAVVPGEPVQVTQVIIEVTGAGRNLPDFKTLLATPPYQPKDILVHQKYEDFKTSLNRTANNLGFFDAKYLKREIRVNPDTRQAQVELRFDTGNRYKVGPVIVTQDVLDDKHLRRYMRVQQGNDYNVDDILKQQRTLENSGYYSEVLVSSRHQQAQNGYVPIEIKTQRRKRYTYTGKIGYGTDTSIRIEAGMDAHWVNRRGHKLSIKGNIGKNLQSIEGSYKVPLWDPDREYSSLSAGWQKDNNNNIKSEAYKVGIDYNRRSDNDWQQTAFINFLNETTQIDNEPKVKAQLTLLGVRVKKTKSDAPLFPTKGWTVGAELQGAKKGLFSDHSLLQGKANAKYLQTLSNKDKVILQTTVGTTLTHEFDDLPKSLRFFAGGQGSVRGYDFESLGPTNEANEVLGGKHLLTLSAEYEKPIVEKWSAAGFVDAGNAFNSTANLSMKVGAGFGVRWRSPLGPVRADIASPTRDPGDVHFYFSLGPDL